MYGYHHSDVQKKKWSKERKGKLPPVFKGSSIMEFVSVLLGNLLSPNCWIVIKKNGCMKLKHYSVSAI